MIDPKNAIVRDGSLFLWNLITQQKDCVTKNSNQVQELKARSKFQTLDLVFY
jgi:hypothetical protein